MDIGLHNNKVCLYNTSNIGVIMTKAELERENKELKRIVKMVAMINTGIYTNEGIKAIYEEAERFIKNVDISTRK